MGYRFDCVFYYVKNLDSAIRFYTDILGFELSSRDTVARFYIDGVLFELVPAVDESKLSGGGNARLCLSVTDIETAAKDLSAKGVRVGAIQAMEDGKLAAFEDLDGNELVLWQYA